MEEKQAAQARWAGLNRFVLISFLISWGLTITFTVIGGSNQIPELGLPWLEIGLIPIFYIAILMFVVFLKMRAQLSKGVLIGSAILAYAFTVLMALSGGNSEVAWVRNTTYLIALVFLLFLASLMGILFYRMWAAIQDQHARTTPGKAIGYLFIPFFNIYWAFQVIWGFSKDCNRFIDRHSIHTNSLSEGLFLSYVILSFGGGLIAWIPVLGPIVQLVTILIAIIMVSAICTVVNDISAAHPVGISSAPARWNKAGFFSLAGVFFARYDRWHLYHNIPSAPGPGDQNSAINPNRNHPGYPGGANRHLKRSL
jgi:hypothetical protein